jgi:uncharacterized protein involved in exopolysaccharide biosynthesis
VFYLRLTFSFIAFVVIFSGGVLYTFNQTKVYRADGMLEVFDPRPIKSLSLEDLLINEAPKGAPSLGELKQLSEAEQEDLNTTFLVLESRMILTGIDQRLQGEMRARFMAPYVDALHFTGPLSPVEVLEANSSFEQVPKSSIFRVYYIHPDPVIAAKVTNFFMQEFIDYYLKSEITGYMKMTEDLRIRLDMTDQTISEMSAVLKEANTPGEEAYRQESELEVLQAFRDQLYAAFLESKTRINLANPRAIIVDSALPPYANNPHKPDISKNLSYAFSLGLFLAALPHVWSAFSKRSGI